MSQIFDRVTIRVSDLDRSRRFYDTALATLGFGDPTRDGELLEWSDLSISQASAEKPVTRHVHIGLAAPSRDVVDEFWRALVEAGFVDDGRPGLREQYEAGYYGAFLLDPDENSIEAVHAENVRRDGSSIDHVWLRVSDVAASRHFYETVAAILGFRLESDRGTRAHFHGDRAGLTVTTSEDSLSVERPRTENAHLAFPAPDPRAVDEFHRVAVAAGYRDNGRPDERRCHAGDYGAFVLDPDGNTVEAVVHS